MRKTPTGTGGVDRPAPPEKVVSLNGKDYVVDQDNYLVDPNDWDEAFAEAMAPEAGIAGGLGHKHWEVIRFIRRFWMERAACPTIYQICRELALHVAGFHHLFPSGYQWGACKLAGISYKADVPYGDYRKAEPDQKSYRIDIWGFLLDPDEWDERFSLLKAGEMKFSEGLTPEHWRVLRFLRQEYFRIRKIPTLSQTCEALGIDLDAFEKIFPDGYLRGAVKLAGLRALHGA